MRTSLMAEDLAAPTATPIPPRSQRATGVPDDITDPRLRQDDVTALVVLVTVFAAGLNYRLVGGVPIGLLLVIGLTPVWWRSIIRMEFAPVMVALGVLAIPAGLYLASRSAETHTISASAQRDAVVLLLGALAVTVAVLWGRAHFPLHVVAMTYAAGDLANALLFTSRSWKYNLAFPVTIIVVAWLGRQSYRIPAAVALVLLGVVTALDRGRSFFAFCVLAACVVVWQSIPTQPGTRMRRWTPLLLLAAIGTAVYQLAIDVLRRGYLGEAAQERTIAQIETSGSLILGGRPQLTATRALMSENPWGYGLGVVPNTRDYALVRSAFESLNQFQSGEHGYLMNYMLRGQFRLHSITSDLWVMYGIVGLLLAITIGYSLARSLSTLISRRRCPPVVAFAAILGLWYLVFEPTYGYGNDVYFTVGIALLPAAMNERSLRSGTAHREDAGTPR